MILRIQAVIYKGSWHRLLKNKLFFNDYAHPGCFSKVNRGIIIIIKSKSLYYNHLIHQPSSLKSIYEQDLILLPLVVTATQSINLRQIIVIIIIVASARLCTYSSFVYTNYGISEAATIFPAVRGLCNTYIQTLGVNFYKARQ